jgi:hypothetical protein
MSMPLSRRQFVKYCAMGAATVPLLQMAAGTNIYKALPGESYAILSAYLSKATAVVWMIGLKFPPVAPLVNTTISACSIYVSVGQYKSKSIVIPLALSRMILGAVPGVVNTIKFANFPIGLIAPAPQFSPWQFFQFIGQGA